MSFSRFRSLAALFLVLCLVLTAPVAAASRDEAAEAIRNAFLLDEKVVDMTEYHLTAEELESLFFELYDSGELPWYAHSYTCTYSELTGHILTFHPKTLDLEEYDPATYELAIQEVLDRTVFPGMTPVQIALSVHDYLAVHSQYDQTLQLRSSYDLLVDGTAVCEGYARAYMDILSRAGIDSVYVTSPAMNHVWNLVEVEGNWYHTDVTWDDPTPDLRGWVSHEYFLLDNSAITQGTNPHFDFGSTQEASTAPLAADPFWQATESPICYESADICYLRMDDGVQHTICRREEQTGTVTVLADLDCGYVDLGQGSFYYENHGLSLWNGTLYYSDMEHVYALSTSGGEPQVIYAHDTAAEGTILRGSYVSDDTLYLSCSSHQGDYTTFSLPLPGAEEHTHSFLPQRREPTCTKDGYSALVCACGATDGTPEVLPATGHSFDEGVLVSEAQGDGPGIRQCTCTRCGETTTVIFHSECSPLDPLRSALFSRFPELEELWALGADPLTFPHDLTTGQGIGLLLALAWLRRRINRWRARRKHRRRRKN